ncbi:hypothetical protein BKA70DRAFT_1446477 [Coprinopsis sp. MPI-PUGE-AT-0042]|nr:hypothetical protein BKA70DRAFT_1446477 [Coprinopsis sp. MPI-PUGE-AT-0042]
MSCSNQKVVLEINFSGTLWFCRGYTEITITPVISELRTLSLCSRQCTIQSVTVSGQPAEFTIQDPLRKYCYDRRPGLLQAHGIEVKDLLGDPSMALSHSSAREASTPEPSTPGNLGQTEPRFAPILVNIAYSPCNPVDGFEFVMPSDPYPYRVPHAYTTPSSPDAA